MTDMLQQVKKTILEHSLLQPGDKVLVALSGGADSVCLLDCMLCLTEELNIKVFAAHVNHCLRGEASDGDEAFVRDLCQLRNVPLFTCRKDIHALAAEKKIGTEAAGRLVRYEFFESVLQAKGLQKIATAHHANDTVETVLMRLIRGTGPLGLGGIPYQNETVIRPLLDVTRTEIEAYLKEKALSFRTDRTNFETVYTRNRVRHELIPFLEKEFNPNFQKNFREQIRLYSANSAYIKKEAETLFSRLVKQASAGYGFSCKALLLEDAFLVSVMLHQTIMQLTDTQEILQHHIDAVMSIVQKGSGAVSLPDNVIAEICHGVLFLRKDTEKVTFCYPIEPGSEIYLAEIDTTITCYKVDAVPTKYDNNTMYLAADTVNGKVLTVRSRTEGDFFYPIGMEGRKKLQDYFVDQKVPYFLRDTIPVVTVNDEIAWVAGYRGDRRFVASKDNNASLCVKLHRGKNSEKLRKRR